MKSVVFALFMCMMALAVALPYPDANPSADADPHRGYGGYRGGYGGYGGGYGGYGGGYGGYRPSYGGYSSYGGSYYRPSYYGR